MIYLASPYSHPDALIRKTRFLVAEQVTAELLSRGLIIFSPIVHTHELALKYNLPGDFEFWQKYCVGMLRIAKVLYVLQMNGTAESVGVQAEIALARSLGIQVYGVDPEVTEVVLWHE